MKKYPALIITVILLAGGAYYTQQYFIELSVGNSAVVVSTTTGEHSAFTEQTAAAVASNSTGTLKILAASSITQTPNITFSIPDTSYGVHAPPGTTVLDVMHVLASTTHFTFTGRGYPSLGFFVESINGKKSSDGNYWFLYLNGKSSDTGVSQTTLEPGDTVEWKYEKSY